MFRPPGDCPVCGEFVPRKSAACPDCGSCAKSGWNEDDEIDYSGANLPDEDFDYDDYARREHSGPLAGKSWWWWVAVVLILVLALSLLGNL